MSDNAARFSLSKDASTCLKGLACLLIVLHHWCARLNGIGYSNPIIDLISLRGGITGVAIFFFLSSYGLTRSQIKHRDSFLSFLKKRFIKVIIPLLVTNILWFVIRHEDKEFVYSLLQILNIHHRLDGVTWFCNVIIICYLLFYVSFLAKTVWGKIFCNWALMIALAVLIAILWPDDPFLVYSLVAFPIGFTIALQQERMKSKSLVYGVCISVLTVLGCMAIMAGQYKNLLVANMYCTLGLLIMLIIWVVYSSRSRKSFLGLKVYIKSFLLWVGAYSYEIYLLHNKFLVFHGDYKMTIWYPITFFAVVIPFSMLLYRLDDRITKLFVK